MTDINKKLFDQIDKLTLSKRIQQWKQAVKSSGWRLFADRAKWTAESWKETEGEDIQIRRAKLLEKILKNIEIRILDFDVIVGRLTPNVIGCATSFDISGDYIPGLWEDKGEINVTMDANVGLDRESLEVLKRQCTCIYR
jgi:formate C-acetyltransferase